MAKRQGQRGPQRIVETRLPAITAGAQRGQHVGIQPQFHTASWVVAALGRPRGLGMAPS